MKSYNERAEATREKIKTYKHRAKARRKALLISVVSVCSCLLIVLNIVLFLPPTNFPDVGIYTGKYKNSEYYEVVKELIALKIGGGSTSGSGGWDSTDNAGVATPEAPESGAAGESGSGMGGSSSSGEHYEETTDNQVAGVTEGDLIKRTNKYIYYLSVPYWVDDGIVLRVYPIDGLQTECIAEFAVTPPSDNYGYGWNNEMYLNKDGTIVTLVLGMSYEWMENGWHRSKSFTEVVNIDVSDHSDIKITERYCVSGSYVSSRLVNGELLLVTNFLVPYYVDIAESDIEQIIPSTGASGEMSCIPAKDIHCPEMPDSSRFTVVCSVDAATLQETGRQAFLSYSQNVYVSENNIYTSYSYSDSLKNNLHWLLGNDNQDVSENKTEISRVEYGGKLEYKGSFTVKGSVKDRFCMDEKDGVLRVVTSLRRSESIRNGNHYSSYQTFGASLYCVDIQTYKTVGKLENFAPENDTVQSVRFDGDKVYVCTAVVIILTDPVFAIDLSDYNNIHFVDTGEIPGYSIALRQFYGDTLLGIGYNGNWYPNQDVKIELYKETESSVESAATFSYIDNGYEYNGQYYQYANVNFSEEYKSYFIDAERGLVGLGLTISAHDYSNGGHTSALINRYILLQYDGENLNLVLDIDLDLESAREYYFYNRARAVYVDGAFYVFTENGFTVAELNI